MTLLKRYKELVQVVIAIVITFSFLVGCLATSSYSRDEAVQVWKNSEVLWVDDKSGNLVFGRIEQPHIQEFFASLNLQPPVPTLVYLHGCSGPSSPNFRFWKLLSRRYGLVIISPNTFARTKWQELCGRQTRAHYATRISDTSYITKQLLKMPWVDRGNLILAGHSEGGRVVAIYPGDEYSVRLISGDSCDDYKGLRSHYPTDRTLVLASTKDKYAGRYACRDSKNRFIVESAMHGMFQLPEVKRAIIGFLDEQIIR